MVRIDSEIFQDFIEQITIIHNNTLTNNSFAAGFKLAKMQEEFIRIYQELKLEEKDGK